MEDTRLALMTGIDIPIPSCQLILHQPSIKEISFLGESDFFVGVQTITLYKSMFTSEDKNALDNITNFQIFMMIMNSKETADKKQAVLKVFSLIFPKYKTMITPQSLIFSSTDGTHMIDDENFEDLQNVARGVFCAKTGPMDQQAFNPANKLAQEIAKKIMRGRERVAELNGTANISIFSQYLSIISVGLSMSLLDLREYTMYMIYDIMERYNLWVGWETDMKIRLAGGKPDNQPENWMKNIHQ